MTVNKRKVRIIEAYMNHSRSPFIHEVLSDGHDRIRARRQFFRPEDETREMARLAVKYGKAWKGVRTEPARQHKEVSA